MSSKFFYDLRNIIFMHIASPLATRMVDNIKIDESDISFRIFFSATIDYFEFCSNGAHITDLNNFFFLWTPENLVDKNKRFERRT